MAVKATVHVQTCVKKGATILKSSYCTQPFKMANITEDKRSGQLHLMLMSSSPGVLSGDEYDIVLRMGEGSDVKLQTQSFQRLFQMRDGAKQLMNVRMEKGSSLFYIPHPSVPHGASHFTAKNKIFLTDNCALIWGEVLTCGRKINGEVFSFAHYHNCTEIFVNEELAVKENLFIRPSEVNMLALGQLEGYTHQASFIFMKEGAHKSVLSESFAEYLSIQKDIEFGITSLPVDGLLVRILGYRGEQLFDCLKNLERLIEDFARLREQTKISQNVE